MTFINSDPEKAQAVVDRWSREGKTDLSELLAVMKRIDEEESEAA